VCFGWKTIKHTVVLILHVCLSEPTIINILWKTKLSSYSVMV